MASNTQYGLKALDGEAERVRQAAQGTRNDALNRAAFRMGALVAGEQLTEERVRQTLMMAALFIGLPRHEADRSITSGLTAGTQDARAPEPRDDAELPAGWLDKWTPKTTAALVLEAQTTERVDYATRTLTTEQLKDIKPPAPLIDGYLYRDTLAWIAAAPGTYKTVLSIHFAASVALGVGCMMPGGTVATQQGPVLYVSGEGTSGLYRRVEAWMAAYASRTTPPILWLPEAVQVSTSAWDYLTEYAAQLQPAMIVLDTQSRMTVGLDENDAKSASIVVDKLDRLRRASGACILTNHHSSKSGATLRGSSVIDGAADTVISLERLGDDDPRVMMRCAKQKEAAPFRKWVMEPRGFADSIVLVKASDQTTPTTSNRK